MKLEITNEKANRLLHRTELQCSVKFEGATPRRDELLKDIAAKKHTNEKLIAIDSVKQEFGKQEASLNAKIYESEKAMNQVEGVKKSKKKKGEEGEEEGAPAKKPVPAAKKAAEKPVEAGAKEA